MSTRSNIIVEDDWSRIQLYRHYDGHPKVVLEDLKQVVDRRLVWPFPRFEANEFAAGIVACWKTGDGNIRIDGNPSGWGELHGDIEYLYVIGPPDYDTGRPILTVYKSNGNHPSREDWLFVGHVGDVYVKGQGVEEDSLLDRKADAEEREAKRETS